MAEYWKPAMRPKTIDIRELKEPISSHMEEVRRGATVMITDQGQPVAQIKPVEVSPETKIQKPGILKWSGRKLSPDIQTFPVQGEKTVAEMLIEDRD